MMDGVACRWVVVEVVGGGGVVEELSIGFGLHV